MEWGRFPRYVPVAERKEKAARKIAQLKKKGETLNPVIAGRTITKTFWGKAWCQHLESYSDYNNRLPRGRTYIRNGSVIDLKILRGEITALVNGSSIYKITAKIKPLSKQIWQKIITECSGKIGSLIELLQGKFSQHVMEIITNQDNGLFPDPLEINFSCSCPDFASMCKHVAASLYGIGVRLDEKPEELFKLRCVDHLELISSSNSVAVLTQNKKPKTKLDNDDLSSLFNIDFEDDSTSKKTSEKNTNKVKVLKKQPSKTKVPKKSSKKNLIKNKPRKDKEIKKILVKKPAAKNP